MSGLKITGFNEDTVAKLQQIQVRMVARLEQLKKVSTLLSEIQEAMRRLRARETQRVMLMEGVSFYPDEELLSNFEDALIAFFNRKNAAINSYEWEIPLAAPKAQEPDDGEHSDLYV